MWDRAQLVRFVLAALPMALSLSACDKHEPPPQSLQPTEQVQAPSPILIDGSSTVHLLSEAILDLYASQLTTDIKYFGLAYYRKYQDRLRFVALDDQNEENGPGAILPTPETVGSGQYAPLSRPLFLYIAANELKRRQVATFTEFYLKSARLVAPDVGYIGLGRGVLRLASTRLEQRKLGSVFSGVHSVVGLTIADLLQAEDDAVSESPNKTIAQNKKK